MDKQALRERYQQNAVAMSHAMKEATEHIEANSQLDLSEDELVEAIDLIATMLSTARYHADRMRVYARLMDSKTYMDSKVKDTQHT